MPTEWYMREYPDDVEKIAEVLHVDPETAGEMWSEYSGMMSATWLIVYDGTLGSFAQWLRDLAERVDKSIDVKHRRDGWD